MAVSRPPRIHLLGIAAAVLSLAAPGCCPPPPDPQTAEFEGTVEGAALAMIHEDADTDEARCEAACRTVATEDLDDIKTCGATGPEDNPDHPWDLANTEISVTCTAVYTPFAFCTGRRPQGHRELAVVGGGRATWFAVHAHLERASVAAFRELAAWLVARGAPPALVRRCCDAAADEVNHADCMEALARRHGADVSAPLADPPIDDLYAVALHNAVEGCVFEAFAAVIAVHQARHADDAELRALFARIAADELRHGQLAWDLHTWLWDQLGEAERISVAKAQARALAALSDSTRRAAAATPPELGWPGVQRATAMARRFAERVCAEAGLAAA